MLEMKMPIYRKLLKWNCFTEIDDNQMSFESSSGSDSDRKSKSPLLEKSACKNGLAQEVPAQKISDVRIYVYKLPCFMCNPMQSLVCYKSRSTEP